MDDEVMDQDEAAARYTGAYPLGSLGTGVGLTYTPRAVTYINTIPYLRQPSTRVYSLRDQGAMVNRVSEQGGVISVTWICGYALVVTYTNCYA